MRCECRERADFFFGGGAAVMIWDSGAGRSIRAHRHVPEHKLDHSDHPGFSGPSGETIKVDGRTKVDFTDDI